MRLATLLAAAALLAPAALGAQRAPTPGLAATDADAGSLRPAELVATRVRGVLQDHGSDAAWLDLAGALPELALSGADIESTFEAARLAERMAMPSQVAQPAVESPPTGGALNPTALLDALSRIDPETAGRLLALALGLVALAMLLRGGSKSPGPRRGGARGGRSRQAVSMAASGMPLYEISRRTGLTRDALAMLLGRDGR